MRRPSTRPGCDRTPRFLPSKFSHSPVNITLWLTGQRGTTKFLIITGVELGGETALRVRSPESPRCEPRANGMTVTWTPGTSGTMTVQLVSGADNAFTSGFTTQCSAPMSLGSVTIPAYALLPHIPGSPSYYQLFTSVNSPFSASGVPYASTAVRMSDQTSSLVTGRGLKKDLPRERHGSIGRNRASIGTDDRRGGDIRSGPCHAQLEGILELPEVVRRIHCVVA